MCESAKKKMNLRSSFNWYIGELPHAQIHIPYRRVFCEQPEHPSVESG